YLQHWPDDQRAGALSCHICILSFRICGDLRHEPIRASAASGNCYSRRCWASAGLAPRLGPVAQRSYVSASRRGALMAPKARPKSSRHVPLKAAFYETRDQTMISGTAQIAPPETGQKMQRKFSGAKVFTSLSEEPALNCALQPHKQVVS